MKKFTILYFIVAIFFLSIITGCQKSGQSTATASNSPTANPTTSEAKKCPNGDKDCDDPYTCSTDGKEVIYWKCKETEHICEKSSYSCIYPLRCKYRIIEGKKQGTCAYST